MLLLICYYKTVIIALGVNLEFIDEFDVTFTLAEKIMVVVADYKIPLLPEIYAVLYSRFTNLNADLSCEVDELLKKTKPLESGGHIGQRLTNIYNKYHGMFDAAEAVDSSVLQMEDKISNVLDAIAIASGSNKEYGDSLQENIGDLKNKPSSVKISSILDRLVNHTESIIHKNEDLKVKLNESALEISYLQKNLGTAKREALVDGLTGIANRRWFDILIKETICNFNKTEKPFCVAMVDIDHFKLFNDTYGHQIGDKVLKAVSNIINNSIREYDIAARYGGEEFALILPNIELMAAFSLCERMRIGVSGKKLRNRNTGKSLGGLNISIGIAEFKSGETGDDVLGRADYCLYEAKENGRNMTFYEGLMEESDIVVNNSHDDINIDLN